VGIDDPRRLDGYGTRPKIWRVICATLLLYALLALVLIGTVLWAAHRVGILGGL
jgi:hypothetical protein